MREFATAAADTPRIREIWEACFDDTKAFGDWFFTHRYSPEQTLSYRENGEILSNLQMVPYRVCLRGKEIESWFIVGAATLPQARKKGHMAALLEASFKEMHEAGVPVSHLYPFQYDFYRRYGYDICSERLLQRFSPADILGSVGLQEASHWPAEVREIDNNTDVEALERCYQACMQHVDGYVVRNTRGFELRLMEHALENGGGLAAVRNGEICAYTLFARQEKKVACAETVYAHPLDLAALLGALGRRFKGMGTIEFSTPVSDTARYFLKDGRARAFIEPFDMLRIIDFAGLMETFEYPIDGQWAIGIQDAHAPWNEGCWKVEISNGRAHVERTDAAADFSCGIGAMAQIMCGLVTAKTMARCGRLQYNDFNQLLQFSEALPALIPYIFEMY
ncbi:MAG: GNAT family N-acetyltransferase [Bacillota bacterium]